jgi:hypothetical protein
MHVQQLNSRAVTRSAIGTERDARCVGLFSLAKNKLAALDSSEISV